MPIRDQLFCALAAMLAAVFVSALAVSIMPAVVARTLWLAVRHRRAPVWVLAVVALFGASCATIPSPAPMLECKYIGMRASDGCKLYECSGMPHRSGREVTLTAIDCPVAPEPEPPEPEEAPTL